jgi:hypothetical protein
MNDFLIINQGRFGISTGYPKAKRHLFSEKWGPDN